MIRSRLLLALCAAAQAGPAAHASFLDTDFYCRVYGCVIVHDGFSFDVYDNFIFANGGQVPPGQRMIPWTGNPVEGQGDVNPVLTGTRTEGFHAIPLEDQGARLGIDTDGDGVADRLPVDDGDGFLDAGDSFGPFNLTASTRLVALDTSAQRSFYLASRTDFYLSAQVFLRGTRDALNDPAQLDNISLRYDVTRTGNDDGMAFGDAARRGNYIRPIGTISSLGDLYAAPQFIMEFRNATRRVDAPELADQSVRFDYVYGFENYDLSMGAGDLRYTIEFDVYNR